MFLFVQIVIGKSTVALSRFSKELKNPSKSSGDGVISGSEEGSEECDDVCLGKSEAICLESGSQRHLQIAPRLGS